MRTSRSWFEALVQLEDHLLDILREILLGILSPNVHDPFVRLGLLGAFAEREGAGTDDERLHERLGWRRARRSALIRRR